MAPVGTQARKIIWDAIDSQGRRMIDQAFPAPLRSNVHENEMRIKFRNGSVWQVVGSDNYDQLVGTNPIGLIFSEYALADPQAWQILRPILAENGGWALFISTPRGGNHFEDLYATAKSSPDWYSELLNVDDTGALSHEVLAAEKKEMSEALFKQEYYCSFYGQVEGSYYAQHFEYLEREKRIAKVSRPR
jgi:hypothetical protein